MTGNGKNGKNGKGAISAEARPVKRCAIYTRKSTTAGLEQDFNSLDAQREACEAYIRNQEAQGWTLLPESYDDGGFTGANTERPAFQHLMVDVEAGKIDVIVTYKVDRLSRSLLDFARIIEIFERHGVSFVSVTQNFSTADAMGRLTLSLLMSFSVFEREMIAERTRDKMLASRKRGKWTGGTVPFGYQSVDKKLVVVENEAAVVREIFSLYLETRSSLAVARSLNERGLLKTVKGKNSLPKPARAWTVQSVGQILTSPIYAGLIRAGDLVVPAEHEAIIGESQYKAVQRLRAAYTPSGPRLGRNPSYLLRGLIRCAHCGAAMTPGSTRKKRKKGDAKEYRYYRCSTRDKQGTDACPSRPLPAEAVEAFVIERIKDVAQDEKLLRETWAKLEGRIATEKATLTKRRQALAGDIARLSLETRRLAESLGSGISGPARQIIEGQLEQTSNLLTDSERQLHNLELRLDALNGSRANFTWVARMLKNFDILWQSMTPVNRRRLVLALVNEITVNEKTDTATVVMRDWAEGISGESEGNRDRPDYQDEASAAGEART